MTTRRLWAWLHFLLARHGWPAAAGLVLLLGAAAGHQWLVVPMQARAEAVQGQWPAMRQRLARQPVAPATDAQRQASLLAALPAPAAALGAIDALHRGALAHGVALSNGAYRLLPSGNTPWMRYQITLPASARYTDLRAWLAEAMNAEPALALDEWSLRRAAVADATVEMRVRLTLFLRGAP